MSETSRNDDPGAILFGKRLVSSTAFKSLFREGMAQMDAAATRLHGKGFADCAADDR